MSKKFTFYWRTGDREVLPGDTPATALNMAGYGGGAVRALDFYAEGENDEWVWNKDSRDWEPKPGSDFAQQLDHIAKKRKS